MEFVLLIFVNIIMGTIFYLILKLKLEKYASDYREKRLKKEMDEIICEFNETAERNITILERKIDYLKKLLEKAGTINKVDFNINDDNRIDKEITTSTDNITYSNKSEQLNNGEIIRENTQIIFSGSNTTDQRFSANNLIAKYHFLVKRKFETIIKSVTKHKNNKEYTPEKNNSYSDLKISSKDKNFASLIESHQSNKTKEVIDVIIKDNDPSERNDVKNPVLSEIELKEMFSSSQDKYLLISELNEKGYPTELISKCSGIPIGEIKLVLDLNSTI